MAHETDKPENIPTPDDSLDAEYRELMKLAGRMAVIAGFLRVQGMK